MGRKPSLVAQNAAQDESWLREQFSNWIRAAAGNIFLGWSPQTGTAYGERAGSGAGVAFLCFTDKNFSYSLV